MENAWVKTLKVARVVFVRRDQRVPLKRCTRVGDSKQRGHDMGQNKDSAWGTPWVWHWLRIIGQTIESHSFHMHLRWCDREQDVQYWWWDMETHWGKNLGAALAAMDRRGTYSLLRNAPEMGRET